MMSSENISFLKPYEQDPFACLPVDPIVQCIPVNQLSAATQKISSSLNYYKRYAVSHTQNNY